MSSNLKIGIVGAGMAGSYLARCLHRMGHEVRVVERQRRERFRARCAWGTEEHVMRRLLAGAGMDFSPYVLYRSSALKMEYRWVTVYGHAWGLCTFDKTRLLLDLVEGLPVEFGVDMDREARRRLVEESDLVVDASGAHRVMLPPVARDFKAPTVEYRYRTDALQWRDFYVYVYRGLLGYLWSFPLGENIYHIGSIATEPHHHRTFEEFQKRYPGTILEKTGGSIRAIPPSRCLPFVQGKVVGVGESIGTVVPMIGEGIQQSLCSASILLDCLHGTTFDGEEYTRRVLRHFRTWDLHARLTDHLLAGDKRGAIPWLMAAGATELGRLSPLSLRWFPRMLRESLRNLQSPHKS